MSLQMQFSKMFFSHNLNGFQQKATTIEILALEKQS